MTKSSTPVDIPWSPDPDEVMICRDGAARGIQTRLVLV